MGALGYWSCLRCCRPAALQVPCGPALSAVPAVLGGTDLRGPFVYRGYHHRGSGLDLRGFLTGARYSPRCCWRAVARRTDWAGRFETGLSAGAVSVWVSYAFWCYDPFGAEEQAVWLIDP